MNIHGPSLGIGAGIAVASILVAFYMIGNVEQTIQPTAAPEQELEPIIIKEPEPEPITAATFLDNASPILGDSNAPITLVEFGDYQCFFCNKFFHDTEGKIIENYVDTGKVRLIFKDYTIIGPDSVTAAHATHCANDQGKFWEYHDTLYDNWDGENNGWASSENLLRFAQDIELDTDTFSQCMLDATHQSKVAASGSDAQALGLTGTPAFFVIGADNQVTKISGAQPYEVFERIFESELEK